MLATSASHEVWELPCADPPCLQSLYLFTCTLYHPIAMPRWSAMVSADMIMFDS